MSVKPEASHKAKKKSATRAPTSKDKKRSKIPIEFVDRNHPWVVENEAWIDAHAQEDEDKWTKDVLEKCSKEFLKLGKKGCNQEKLLELLWHVRICEETYSSSLPNTSMTLESVRQLQQELTDATEKIIRLNVGMFELILSYNKDWRHLLDLPESLRQYVKASRLLTEGDANNLTPLLDQRAKQLNNVVVCRLIDYVHEKTGKWYDRDLGKMVAAACGKSVDQDYMEQHKQVRRRHYEDLKSYL